MNHDPSQPSDLLALVTARSIRLVRSRPGELRRLVRIPVGGALTVAVAARVADALLDAQPTDRVFVLPRDRTALPVATEFAEALDARHPGDHADVLPNLDSLLAVADAAAPTPDTGTGRHLLPRPSATPRTVRLSPPSRV